MIPYARMLGGLAAVLSIAGCAAGNVAPAAVPSEPLPGRFEVVGRGPVTGTHTADLWVFRGVNGRDYAYTTTWGACQGCYGDRMYAWDVSDPAKPVLTDSVVVDARIVNDVTVNREGTLAVITREGASNRRNGVVLLDLQDPAHPKVASEYWETLTGGVHTTFIDGNYLYAVHDGTADLHILDISDPGKPRQVARWGVDNNPGKYLHDVWVEDGLAYLAYWDDGLVILDVGNGVRGGTPEKPRPVGQANYRYRWRGGTYGNTHMAVPYTNRAGRKYVFVGDEIFPPNFDANEDFAPGGYLHVFDATDPTNPVEVAKYEIPEAGSHNIWIHDDILYIAYYNAGLRALDVSGELKGDLRRQGRELAALSTTDAQSMFPNRPFTMTPMWHRGLVYAADFNSGLWISRLVLPEAAVPVEGGGR